MQKQIKQNNEIRMRHAVCSIVSYKLKTRKNEQRGTKKKGQGTKFKTKIKTNQKKKTESYSFLYNESNSIIYDLSDHWPQQK